MKHFTLAAGLVLANIAGIAQAEIISSDPYALGGDRRYMMTDSSDTNGFMIANEFNVTYRLDQFVMGGAAHYPPALADGLTGGTSMLTGAARFGGAESVSGGTLVAFDPASASFFDIAHSGGFGMSGATTYTTEITQLDLHGFSPDLPGNGEWMIRESPTLESLGSYTVHSLGDGTYEIHSYFDIFMELSLDGGQTWSAAQDVFGNAASAHYELVAIPTPGALALLGFVGLLNRQRRR